MSLPTVSSYLFFFLFQDNLLVHFSIFYFLTAVKIQIPLLFSYSLLGSNLKEY